ncbi:hypothetical protein [Gorillibacterium sp. CAU 1737]|uniref:hypothetical protein n=1 Tax=Gorillibacterium sp. CAU 1737 TaxID=3140362 RepID=UPI0032612114
MKAKRILIIGTMAAALTAGSGVGAAQAESRALDTSMKLRAPSAIVRTVESTRKEDDLRETLGLASDDELYDELYEGKSLAEIAREHSKDAQVVIDLQVAQLEGQLRERLNAGSITYAQYAAHLAELEAVVTRSVYGDAQ